MLRELAHANRYKNIDCRCGKRNQVEIIDARTRLDAFKAWADYTDGKPSTRQATVNPDQVSQQLEELTEAELAAALAAES